jgi:MFS family permease
MEFAFMLPIISLIYSEFGMPQHLIGLAIGGPYIFYMISCPLIFLLVNKMDKRGIIIIGLILGTFSMLSIGNYDVLNEFFQDSEDIDARYIMVLGGACGICVAMALINVPTMPEMLQ